MALIRLDDIRKTYHHQRIADLAGDRDRLALEKPAACRWPGSARRLNAGDGLQYGVDPWA